MQKLEGGGVKEQKGEGKGKQMAGPVRQGLWPRRTLKSEHGKAQLACFLH